MFKVSAQVYVSANGNAGVLDSAPNSAVPPAVSR
jgi:hypothetical protein